jgi:hypothetical protein
MIGFETFGADAAGAETGAVAVDKRVLRDGCDASDVTHHDDWSTGRAPTVACCFLQTMQQYTFAFLRQVQY